MSIGFRHLCASFVAAHWKWRVRVSRQIFLQSSVPARCFSTLRSHPEKSFARSWTSILLASVFLFEILHQSPQIKAFHVIIYVTASIKKSTCRLIGILTEINFTYLCAEWHVSLKQTIEFTIIRNKWLTCSLFGINAFCQFISFTNLYQILKGLTTPSEREKNQWTMKKIKATNIKENFCFLFRFRSV